jgi:hypothetical protein
MPADFDSRHLDLLNDAILNGRAKHIFLPSSVANLMRRTRRFPWLPGNPTPSDGPFRTWLNRTDKAVHSYKHFSARYAKGEQAAEFAAIRRFIPPVSDALAFRSQ